MVIGDLASLCCGIIHNYNGEINVCTLFIKVVVKCVNCDEGDEIEPESR